MNIYMFNSAKTWLSIRLVQNSRHDEPVIGKENATQHHEVDKPQIPEKLKILKKICQHAGG